MLTLATTAGAFGTATVELQFGTATLPSPILTYADVC
jgi:hypothetical protein